MIIATGNEASATASDTSGPAAAMAISSRGRGASMDSGARPPMKPSVIAVVGTPHRRPTRACETSCATTVTRKPRATITPMSQCSGAPSPGAVAAACWLPMNVTTASTKAHANEMRTSIPNSRARGRPPLTLVPPALRGRRRGLPAEVSGTAPRMATVRARRRATQLMASARTITTTPTPIALSTQNCCGKSWTSRSVPGSNR